MVVQGNNSKIEIKLKNVENINDSYKTKCDIVVMYTGVNYYKERYTLEAIMDAIPTLKNTPILGVFNFAKKDFEDHVPRTTKEGYSTHETTIYGHVPESATVEVDLREILKHDGSKETVQEIVVKDCILHTGIYGELVEVLNESKSQSMEVVWLDTQYNEEEDITEILKFQFKALCILGNDITPVYENGNVGIIKELIYSQQEESKKRSLKHIEQYITEMELQENKEFVNKVYSIYENKKEEIQVDKFLQEYLAKYSMTEEQALELETKVTVKDDKLFIEDKEVEYTEDNLTELNEQLDAYMMELGYAVEDEVIENEKDEEKEEEKSVEELLEEYNLTKEEIETVVNLDSVDIPSLEVLLKTLNIDAVKEAYEKNKKEEESKLTLIEDLEDKMKEELVNVLIQSIESVLEGVTKEGQNYSLKSDLNTLDSLVYNKAYTVVDVLDTLAFNHVVNNSPKLVKSTIEELGKTITELYEAYQLAVTNSAEIQELLDKNTEKLTAYETKENKDNVDKVLEEFDFTAEDFTEDVYSMDSESVKTLCYVTLGKKEYSKQNGSKNYSTQIPKNFKNTDNDETHDVDKLISELKSM